MRTIISSTTSESIQNEGLGEKIQGWEDGLRIPVTPGNFEWWYFDAHFDDPSTDEPARNCTAVIVFSTKPILERGGPLKPNVMITITYPNGKKSSEFQFSPPSQFSSARDSCDVRIGPSHVKGDLHTYRLLASTSDLSADLIFTGSVPPWRPGAGKIYFGDHNHFFGWLPSIPYGTVEGTLTFGGQTCHVRGNGYHDHNWGSVGLNEVMDHWYWGRAHLGEYTLIFVEQVAARKFGNVLLPVFMLAKGDQILTGDGAPLKLMTAKFQVHPGGRAFPNDVDFHWQNKTGSIHLALREPAIIEATSLLETFPAWHGPIFRLFANPYYFRFNAKLELSIHLGDLNDSLTGPALYEIMILQGKSHP